MEKTNKSLIRYAPSFSAGISGDGQVPGITGDYPYTAQILAEFLGWAEPSGRPQERLSDALTDLENMEEWATNAAVVQETVRATVEAYAAGEIVLPAIETKAAASMRRYAPSFIPGDRYHVGGTPRHGNNVYTVQTVATFLGWVEQTGREQHRVSDALSALEYIEEGVLTESDFDGPTRPLRVAPGGY